VVKLRQQSDIAVAETMNQIQLPKRVRAVERTLEDPRDLLRELRVRGRRRQRQLPHVVLEIELGVVDPVRIVQPERHLLQTPTKRRQQRQPLGDHAPHIG
jgi:hypothetical protein